MINVAPGLSASRHPLAEMWDGRVDDGDDFSDILTELEVCRWRGTAMPWSAHVRSPVPARLAKFEEGGVNWFDGVHPQDLARVQANIMDAARGHASQPFEYRMGTGPAEIIWVRHWWSKGTGSRAPYGRGQVNGVIQIIDERKSLEAECIKVGVWVQQRIGQELHDDVCQVLAGVACMLERFGRETRAVIPQAVPALNELSSQVRESMIRARSLAHGLMPTHLIELGLPDALEELARQAAASWGLTVRTHLTGEFSRLSPEQGLHFYRIAQEAISNAAKHGKASKVELVLQRRGCEICLSIQDNGCGLPASGAWAHGLGLHTMRYRAASMGATIAITRGPDGGTLITVNGRCVDTPGPVQRHGA